MKSLLILAALFLAFGIVGDIDYQAATGLAAEHAGNLPLIAAASEGGRNHVSR